MNSQSSIRRSHFYTPKVLWLGLALLSIVGCLDNAKTHTTNTAVRPVAHAGIDQSFTVNRTVTLDSLGSYDPLSGPLSYRWSVVSHPSGSQVTITNPTSIFPTATLDVPGDYVFQLIVNNGRQDSLPDTVTYSSSNTQPVAHAGLDKKVSKGSTVTLNGSRSFDMDGDALSYQWEFVQRPSGSTATLTDADSPFASFVADATGRYEVGLVVNDGTADSPQDTVIVSDENLAPVAYAGQNLVGVENQQVTLDASASLDFDGDALTYLWSITSQPSGSSATLASSDVLHPTLTPDMAGDYVLQLIVNDGQANSLPSTVHLHVTPDTQVATTNTNPVADAGPAQTVNVQDVVALNGQASYDANGDTLSFQWSMTTAPSGSASTLANTDQSSTSFTPDVAGLYVVQLVVDDGSQSSLPSMISITANAPTAITTTSLPAGHSYFYSSTEGGTQGVGGLYAIDSLNLNSVSLLKELEGVSPIATRADMSLIYHEDQKVFYTQLNLVGSDNGGAVLRFDPSTDAVTQVASLRGHDDTGSRVDGYQYPVTFSPDGKYLFGSYSVGGKDSKGGVYMLSIDSNASDFGQVYYIFELGDGAVSADNPAINRELIPGITTQGVFIDANKVVFSSSRLLFGSNQQDKDNTFYITPSDTNDWSQPWEAHSFHGIEVSAGPYFIMGEPDYAWKAISAAGGTHLNYGQIVVYDCSRSMGLKYWGSPSSTNVYTLCKGAGRYGDQAGLLHATASSPGIVRRFSNWGDREAVGFNTSAATELMVLNNKGPLTDLYADLVSLGQSTTLTPDPSQIKRMEKSNKSDITLFTGNEQRGYFFLGDPGISNDPNDSINDRYIVTLSKDGGTHKLGAIVKYDQLDQSVSVTSLGYSDGAYPYGRPLHHSNGKIFGSMKVSKGRPLGSGHYAYTPTDGTLTYGPPSKTLGPSIHLEEGGDGSLYGLGIDVDFIQRNHVQTLYKMDPDSFAITELARLDAVGRIYPIFVPSLAGDHLFGLSESSPYCYNLATNTLASGVSFASNGARTPVRGFTYFASNDHWYLPTAESSVADQGTIQKITNSCSAPVRTDAITGLTDIPSTQMLASSTSRLLYGTQNGKLMSFNPSDDSVAQLADFAGDFAGSSVAVVGYLIENSSQQIAGIVEVVSGTNVTSHHLFSVSVSGGAATYAVLPENLARDVNYPGIIEMN